MHNPAVGFLKPRGGLFTGQAKGFYWNGNGLTPPPDSRETSARVTICAGETCSRCAIACRRP
jgi:hypothetical protein